MWKKFLFWTIAISVTLIIAVYQRMTGPSYPKSFKISYNDYRTIIKLPRSQTGIADAMIRLDIPDTNISGKLFFEKINADGRTDTIAFHRENNELVAWLPKQPPAGKLNYGLVLTDNKGKVIFETNNVIIRFKDNVPTYILIPHVLFIFIAMLFSTLTGLYAIGNMVSYRIYALLTIILFFLGGLLLGPIVQKFAFGEFWTGFPLGKDLTDNKVLIAFIIWVIAWIGNRKKERPYLMIIAAISYLVISLIPHSLRGSELDYNTGEIKTGMIYLFKTLSFYMA